NKGGKVAFPGDFFMGFSGGCGKVSPICLCGFRLRCLGREGAKAKYEQQVDKGDKKEQNGEW
ncbi:MAG: hypothetical protein NTX34_03855, partial [Cytophagales bacterium]|nr:hypothetical protein [Cytophagales bacterium]